MIVLNRKPTQTITVGHHLVLTVVRIKRSGSVTLRIGKYEHELAEGYTSQIEPGVTIKVLRVRSGNADIGIVAPEKLKVYRGEIYAQIKAQQDAEARRLAMPTQVGQAIFGFFLALSAWPMYLLQMAGA